MAPAVQDSMLRLVAREISVNIELMNADSERLPQHAHDITQYRAGRIHALADLIVSILDDEEAG